jgi:predicted dehydrogenase
MIDGSAEQFLGIVLEYPETPTAEASVRITRRAPGGASVPIGVLGAGNFGKAILLPILRKVGAFDPRILCAGTGLTAGQAAERFGFARAVADERLVITDSEIKAVFIATRHSQHGRQVLEALQSGKHVFTEKPLALTSEEIVAIDQVMGGHGPLLMVGFNRRFSPPIKIARKLFEETAGPKTVSIRINAGAIPPDHWAQSEEEGGGRLIGEACHAIDLATFLIHSRPVRVFAESIGGPSAPPITDDQCFITLRHEDGSISSIGYLAGGDRAYAKERVEIMGGGRIAIIEDFRELTTVINGKVKTEKRWQQEKGYREEIEAFAKALSQGGPSPIPWEEIRAVSLASILAVRSLREGLPMDIP